jgi:hypothetical protein
MTYMNTKMTGYHDHPDRIAKAPEGVDPPGLLAITTSVDTLAEQP